MKEGTLVSVNQDALPDDTQDHNVLATEGYLWVRIAHPDKSFTLVTRDETLNWYRSLATGFEHPWFDNEIIVAPNDA